MYETSAINAQPVKKQVPGCCCCNETNEPPSDVYMIGVGCGGREGSRATCGVCLCVVAQNLNVHFYDDASPPRWMGMLLRLDVCFFIGCAVFVAAPGECCRW